MCSNRIISRRELGEAELERAWKGNGEGKKVEGNRIVEIKLGYDRGGK